MNTWVRRSLNVGALTAGALLASGAAAGAAQAGPGMTSTDNVGIGNGTQLLLPVQAPINICGNAVAVAGVAGAGCQGGSAASLDPEWGYDHFRRHSGPGLATNDNVGLLNGTQVYAPVQVPINACGNAVAVAGVAGAGCQGGADAALDGDRPGKHHGKGKGKGKGKGHGGYEDAEQPEAGAVASSGGDATAMSAASHHSDATITSGNLGVLNGTQALVPVQIPINICGNAVSLLGVAGAGC
jgi:hypothetical protein